MNEPWNMRNAAKKGLLLAAHCGSFGEFIPSNSLNAFEAALYQGAHIIELDVTKSKDGTLFVMHPGKEQSCLGTSRRLSEMRDREIKAIPRRTGIEDVTDTPLCTFDEALEYLKNRCFINIDKFPTCPKEIIRAVRRQNMEEQVLVKTEAQEKWFSYMEENAPEFPYMVFARQEDSVSPVLVKRRLNYLGTEVLFASESSFLSTSEYIEQMHQMNLLVWVNALQYATNTILAAGHDDTVSIMGKPDEGWGWLVKQGYDIIQTDWLSAIQRYLDKN